MEIKYENGMQRFKTNTLVADAMTKKMLNIDNFPPSLLIKLFLFQIY